MNDFTHDFWGWYVAIITVLSIVACAVLLRALSTRKLAPGEKAGVMGHVWDEDLEEYNNPLPNWWRWLFYITLFFGMAYIVFFPGLGVFNGVLKWSSTGQYETEIARAEERFGPLYARYAAMDLKEVAADAQAREMGQRLFVNYCSQCHASDGRGSRGFPNLADRDWLWGGDPQAIKASITAGRQGIMPPFGAALGDEGVKDVAHYVLSLSGKTHDGLRAVRGKPLFEANCTACHGPEGKGNPALGAPDLTDEVWLHGRGESSIIETVSKGRHNVMPAWGEFLGEARTHILAAYVWSLSNVR
ncbi:MAG TPA: cytochrome-c oxidase, cbb3-type subunit III [Burkholderiales bacterium]|jgi:cytochrome c oxidase cbb3-type subunit 3|nr:cytochrome-c oxidase, cbb3-type subunit III [Burkholderiales bacterium]